MTRCNLLSVALLALLMATAEAKDPLGQTVVWPENGQPVLRFVFGNSKKARPTDASTTIHAKLLLKTSGAKRFQTRCFRCTYLIRATFGSARVICRSAM
jgi:hypothetical protein